MLKKKSMFKWSNRPGKFAITSGVLNEMDDETYGKIFSRVSVSRVEVREDSVHYEGFSNFFDNAFDEEKPAPSYIICFYRFANGSFDIKAKRVLE